MEDNIIDICICCNNKKARKRITWEIKKIINKEISRGNIVSHTIEEIKVDSAKDIDANEWATGGKDENRR